MSELSWNDVRKGDKVKVKHAQGATIEGVYGGAGYGNLCFISGLNYNVQSLELLEHTPVFQHGDIALIVSGSNTRYVGIYNETDDTFWSDSGGKGAKIHNAANNHFIMKIKRLGNVND